MTELERRLRSALTELAEEVPPSHNAWAEHERRLALKSPRTRVRPALMAAVAAAVVAMIAVPVAILNLKPSGVDQAAIPTSDTSPPPPDTSALVTSNRYRPIDGERLLTEPQTVATLDKGNGNYLESVAYTVYSDKVKSAELCFASLPPHAKVNDPDRGMCTPVKPSAKRLVWYQGFVLNTPNSTAYLYVAAPQVSSILVRRGENDGYRQGYRIGQCPDFSVLVVNLGSTSAPKSYTARNDAMQDLENG